MMRFAWALAVLVLAGCGESPAPSLAGPTSLEAPRMLATEHEPEPISEPPTDVAIAGTITDSVAGTIVGSFASTVPVLPARIAVAAPGYVTREAWINTATPRVDLFPEREFSLRFYRQLLRNDFERGGDPMEPLWILAQAPLFYMEVEGPRGLPLQVARTLEQLARKLVPELTGGRFQVTRWETGPTPRPRQTGWIVIERRDEAGICGRAYVGATAGQILLDGEHQCRIASTFAHELGHAFGSWHVDERGAMMYPQGEDVGQSTTDAPNARERHHMRLAYGRQRGSTDVDIDPAQPTASAAYLVVD